MSGRPIKRTLRGRLTDGDGVACNGGHEQTEGPKEMDGQKVFAEDVHDARQSEKIPGGLMSNSSR